MGTPPFSHTLRDGGVFDLVEFKTINEELLLLFLLSPRPRQFPRDEEAPDQLVGIKIVAPRASEQHIASRGSRPPPNASRTNYQASSRLQKGDPKKSQATTFLVWKHPLPSELACSRNFPAIRSAYLLLKAISAPTRAKRHRKENHHGRNHRSRSSNHVSRNAHRGTRNVHLLSSAQTPHGRATGRHAAGRAPSPWSPTLPRQPTPAAQEFC